MNKQTYDSLNTIIDICISNLRSSSMKTDCVKYLIDDRKLDPKIVIKYNLGYFPRNISKVKELVPNSSMKSLSILNKIGGSDFSDFFYLVFPIYDEYSRLVGFGGRTLLSDFERRSFNIPKYKNTSFKKTGILYGLNLSRRAIIEKQNVYVVEGYFDQIALSSNGVDNSVAICGTSFSKEHFYMLSKYTDTITFILDNDEPGINAMKNISKKFSAKGIKIKFKLIPSKYKDVDELFRGTNGIDFLSKLRDYQPDWPGEL